MGSSGRLHTLWAFIAFAGVSNPLVARSETPLPVTTTATQAPFSHAAFDSVLVRFLHDGRVDYGGLSRDRLTLERYLAAIAVARPEDWARDEQVAFWVNAYDARVLDGVIRRPGLKSVLDVGKKLGIPSLGFFRERRMTAGRELTLDDIEHRILRERFQEPRVHFVLNCASISCPELPARALSGARLEADLDAATRRFLADPSRNRIEPARGLWLSAIFKWYRDDFRASHGSVQAFIERYGPGSGPFAPDLPVRFLAYDWALNGGW